MGVFFGLDINIILARCNATEIIIAMSPVIASGLSYMFASGLARSSAFINSTVSKEYILLNFGVVAFFIGFFGSVSQLVGKPLAITGLIAIMISVALHLANIILISRPKKTPTAREKGFGDDY